MAFTMKQMALTVAAMGVLSFILGVIAENKKPASGIPTVREGLVICHYPSDPSISLGYLSGAALIAATLVGLWSLFYPYKGKSVPGNALFRNTTFVVFFQIAAWVSLLGEAMMLWATISEHLHLTHIVHHNMHSNCPTAKTGLFGGAAFLALNASLFWLVCLMLVDNAREDYFIEQEEDHKGEYGQVLTTDYETKEAGKV